MSGYFDNRVTRKVWKNTNGTKLLTVNGFLSEGEYNLEIVDDSSEYVTIKFSKN